MAEEDQGESEGEENDKENGEDEDDEEGGEGEGDDMQLAWEMLEMAKLIYNKQAAPPASELAGAKPGRVLTRRHVSVSRQRRICWCGHVAACFKNT